MRKSSETEVPSRSFNESFHLSEFEQIRREIELHLADRRKVETQYVIAIFAIYAWLFSRPTDANVDALLVSLATGFPMVIAIFGFLKWSALMVRTIELGEYIAKLEEHLTETPEFGWEHHLAKNRQTKPFMSQIEGQSGRIFWIGLIVLTLAVFVWFAFFQSQPSAPTAM